MSVPNKGLRSFFPYSLDKSCMALSYHLHVMLTQVKGAIARADRRRQVAAARAPAIRHGRGADRAGADGQQRVDRPAGVSALAQEVVTHGIDRHSRFDDLTVNYGGKTGAARRVARRFRRTRSSGSSARPTRGKTTLLKCINRTIDFIATAKVEGQVLVGGQDVRRMRNVYELRRRIGMVFPLPVGLAAVDLRQRGLRPADGRPAAARRARRAGRNAACGRRRCGTK